jgi:hypothetical protein
MSAAPEPELDIEWLAVVDNPYHNHHRDAHRTLVESAFLVLTPGIILVPVGLLIAAAQYYHCDCEGCRMERAAQTREKRKRFENKMD